MVAVNFKDGRIKDALELCRRGATEFSENYSVLYDLSSLIIHFGYYAESVPLLRRVVATNSDNVDALTNLATALRVSGHVGESIEVLRRKIALSPSSVSQVNLSAMLFDTGDIWGAVQAAQVGCELDPGNHNAFYNLGNALVELGRFQEAFNAFIKAIEIKPDFADSYFRVGQLQLLNGIFPDGWRNYEWRWRLKEYEWGKIFAARRWAGESLLGKSLLVFAEQGLGDTIQFSRFLRGERFQGCNVIFSVQERILRLISSVWPNVIPITAPQPACDYCVPLLSIPGIVCSSFDDIPREGRYIFPEPQLIEKWKQVLCRKPGLRVGISWQGRPGTEIDRGRSVPLAMFSALRDVSGVRFISLQKFAGAEQLCSNDACGFIEKIEEDFDVGADAFIDTAAIMANLDLVITTDTAIAHLAGAVGCPTWILLKHIPDWRWQLGSRETLWYPGARLFRQSAMGNWEGVFSDVRDQIGRFVAEKTGS